MRASVRIVFLLLKTTCGGNNHAGPANAGIQAAVFQRTDYPTVEVSMGLGWHMHRCTHMLLYIRMCIHTYLHTAYIYINTHIRTYILYVFVCVCVCVCVHACVHV